MPGTSLPSSFFVRSFAVVALVSIPCIAVGQDTDYGDAAGYGDAGHSQNGLLETVIAVNVDDNWQTIPLRAVYDNPVVVCARNLDSSADQEAVVRIDNVTGTSFDVRLQIPSNQLGSNASDVYCLVVEEGDYDLSAVGGPKFEAHTVLSTETNGFEGFFGWASADTEDVTADLAQSYTNPVVLGQVMSFNEPRHSQFWAHDCTDRDNPPSAAGVCVSKHVGKDTDTTARGDETLGYVVFEAGSDTVNDRNWVAEVGSVLIEGVDNSPPYNYGLGNTYGSGTVTQAAELGGHGGFAVLYGPAPLDSGEIDLAIDEDTIVDDRTHTQERVAYFLMETGEGILLQEPYMGFNPGDLEAPQSDANALADDNVDTSGRGVGSDEIGVDFVTSYTPTLTVTANVRAHNPTSGDVTLCGWMDGPVVNGTFEPGEVAEEGCLTLPPGSSTETLSWTGLPESGYVTFTRFRISSDALTASDTTGLASDGEAEDFILTVTPPPPPDRDFGDAPASYGDAAHGQAPVLETRLVSGANETWQPVQLRGDYTAPVVVCSPHLLADTDDERVVRVQNVDEQSFQVRVQRPGAAFAGPWQVSCLIAEAGEGTLPDGRRILAGTVESNGTNGKFLADTWSPSVTENVTPAAPFTDPVVFGQVMTFNDPDFSVFWSNDCSSQFDPPDAGGICVGKHVGEDSGGRADETLGYIIAESAGGSLGTEAENGAGYLVGLGADIVQGVDNSPPYSYVSGPEYVSGVVTQSAMDGGDGGWAVLFGPDPVSASLVNMAIDEDTIFDTERGHTTEQVAAWVFDRENVFLLNAPYIGAEPGDLEPTSQSGAAADGDDSNDTSAVSAGSDEEGVTFTYLGAGSIEASISVNNFADVDATLCAWLDVPDMLGVADGVFDDTDLGALDCATVAPNTGTPQSPVTFSWTGLPTTVPYTTYARIRITTDPLTANDAAVEAFDGEVEDYRIIVDPTAVTLGSFSLDVVQVADLLADNGLSRQGMLAMLASWDADAAGALQEASRDEIAAALVGYLDPDGDNRVVEVSWETLEERGTLGFYVERRASPGGWNRVNERMLPALPIAPMGAQYQLLDPGADTGAKLLYRLIEQEARGTTRSYGPFRLAPGDEL